MAAKTHSDANQKWQTDLPKHPVFGALSATVSEENSREREEFPERTSRNILIENDGEIFIWNSSNTSVLTANLKNLHFEKEWSAKFQTFVCTETPLFDVYSMLFSPSSKYLLLVGQRGIMVLEMPTRWGKFAAYDGGSEEVLCRTIPIDSRFFVTNHKIKVLDVKWHPGSKPDTHLMVLTSDNNLRLYNILKPSSPIETISVGESSSLTAEYSQKSISVGSLSAVAAALGEKATAFDFAPAVRDINSKARPSYDDIEPDIAYPVFILRENGDICYLLHRISQIRHQPMVVGPLTMFPAADDNYGLDACSLLCLQCQPPVIAMATTSGKIYHCIALESEESDDADEEEDFWSRHGQVQTNSFQRKLSLFVHECVELQLCLLNDGTGSQSDRGSTGEESDEHENLSLLRLEQDPVSPYLYHCSHNAGVHTVSLPWTKKLQSYCMQDDQSYFDIDEAAIVYHMICTSPTASSLSPVLGVGVVNNKILGSAILCLTSNMECIVKPLNLLDRPHSPPTTEADLETSYESTGFSPIRQLNVGLFKSQIEKILTRNTSTPLLRGGEESEKLSQQELYQLLIQAQEILRSQYIQKQNEAREEIEKKNLDPKRSEETADRKFEKT
ncbi:nuclear pore complex protein Nup88-like isoform X2 [Stylophora pistillata]|uniref:nuclear pore complex protein Nup88-like isoform X2 n=1 Tax=Stylophora pistillata TaxID=50429 RepID=UPI000C03DD08|nr:nuclear pore complex protein Nup88-like isoform X2 [Stylophora pistillata]